MMSHTSPSDSDSPRSSVSTTTTDDDASLSCESSESSVPSVPSTTTTDWMAQVEPLLAPSESRLVLQAEKAYPQAWELYKQHQAAFWTAEEIDTAEDAKDLRRMTADELSFLHLTLAFFVASEGTVMENVNCNFAVEVQVPEMRAFYQFQAAMEMVHSETYTMLLEQYVTDPHERRRLFSALTNVPCIRAKIQWALRWMNSAGPRTDPVTSLVEAQAVAHNFAQRLVAFCAFEGICFQASFCGIFWLKKRGLLPGLTFSNELISRDEAMHVQFSAWAYQQLQNRLTAAEVYAIIDSAVVVEKEYVRTVMQCHLLGLNQDLMVQYVEMIADAVLDLLGYPALYHASNPYPWMDTMGVNGKTNFFEKRVSEYQQARKHARPIVAVVVTPDSVAVRPQLGAGAGATMTPVTTPDLDPDAINF